MNIKKTKKSMNLMPYILKFIQYKNKQNGLQ